MLIIKLVLGFGYSVLNEQVVGTVFMTILLMLLGLLQVYMYSFHPPFVQRDINAVYAGGGGCLFLASSCLLLAQTIGARDMYMTVFVGIPSFFGTVFFMVRYRLDHIGRGNLHHCQSLADI